MKTGKLLHRIESTLPKNRNIILIGHSVRVELTILRALGFDVNTKRISAVIDTIKLANEVFGFWGGSLGELLTALQCPFSQLHCGGNDAYFTLKAALLLTARGNHTTPPMDNPLLSERPTPYRLDPEVKAAMKKDKRRQKSRKYQSKFWTAEQQDQIRAERAAKRQAGGGNLV